MSRYTSRSSGGRPRQLPSSALTKRIIAALLSFDISCDCKPTLIVSCAIGTQQGCRERRACGICTCRLRWLPVCLRQGPHGCRKCREGKSCDCLRDWMPRCLASGCAERRRGRRCDCPRTPLEMCPHVQAKLRAHADLTPDEANRVADTWAQQLWILLPGTGLDDGYADRPLAAAGVALRAGPHAAHLMELRHSMKRSLWHPDDDRWPDGEAMKRQAAGLRHLLGGGVL